MSSTPVHVSCPAGTITGYTEGDVNYFHSVDYSLIPGDFENAVKLNAARDLDARTPRPDAVALTITAPQQATDAPVLVYIHGGRYENGTHEDPRAEGTANARAGIIQVQVGYRVGLQGFAQFHDDESFASAASTIASWRWSGFRAISSPSAATPQTSPSSASPPAPPPPCG